MGYGIAWRFQHYSFSGRSSVSLYLNMRLAHCLFLVLCGRMRYAISSWLRVLCQSNIGISRSHSLFWFYLSFCRALQEKLWCPLYIPFHFFFCCLYIFFCKYKTYFSNKQKKQCMIDYKSRIYKSSKTQIKCIFTKRRHHMYSGENPKGKNSIVKIILF
jgi:hypothetical protein